RHWPWAVHEPRHHRQAARRHHRGRHRARRVHRVSRRAAAGKRPGQGWQRMKTQAPTDADQADIAELKRQLEARTAERDEALAHQRATSEVLQVISSSPGELEPVFNSMLQNAVRICEAKFGNLFLIDGDRARWVAGVGTPPKLVQFFSESE